MGRSPRQPRSATALDVLSFCAEEAQLQGQCSLAEMPRLADSVMRGADGLAPPRVRWQAAGSTRRVLGGAPRQVIDLRVEAPIALQCQRCLQPVGVALDVQRRLVFVPGEDEAARLDEEAGDEEDVLALVARLDLLALVEDELLLALPIVPRHDQCPDAGEVGSQAPAVGGEPATGTTTTHRPFAQALAALRRGNS